MNYIITDPVGVSRYNSEVGVFFPIVDGVIKTNFTCRDSLQYTWERFLQMDAPYNGKVLQIAFTQDNVSYEKYLAFWTPIFQKLGKKSVFLFHTATIGDKPMDKTIVINTRRFWAQNAITRSVFSMLIRASFLYPDFATASKDYYIMRDTLDALNYFLDGNIIPTFPQDDCSHGFFYYFNKAANPNIAAILTKPKI
jgi:hypothetical protein